MTVLHGAMHLMNLLYQTKCSCHRSCLQCEFGNLHCQMKAAMAMFMFFFHN